MKKYSVLLKYPDYMNDGGNETYYAWVQADTVPQAIILAQSEAANHNDIDDATDFVCLLITEGYNRGMLIPED